MEAVKHFWKTREMQGKKQGSDSGKKDYGQRRLVTGGKQVDYLLDDEEIVSTLNQLESISQESY